MKLPIELNDRYLKDVLANVSLNDLPNEEWKLVEGFENYAISNYGRIKSLERWAVNPHGIKRKILDSIKKPHVFKYFNRYIGKTFYNVRCTFSIEGRKHGKSVARLVYYHFVEKFDMNDRLILISYKDDNRFHVHAGNLEKLTVSEAHYKSIKAGRGNKGNYEHPVSQYTADGKLIRSFESIYAASDALDIDYVNILQVINKIRITAGGFRWFLKNEDITQKDIMSIAYKKADKVFNSSLWEKLGKPPVDKKDPPPCMNLSLDDLPGEKWKPIPGAEEHFLISNKGRIKRLNHCTQGKNKMFLQEKILSILVDFHTDNHYYFYTNITYKDRRIQIRINKFLYYCFVDQFDLNDRGLVVVNHNMPLWDIKLSKLELCASVSHLKNKE